MKASISGADVYARVTGRIIAALESGIRPWRKPWQSGQTGNMPALPLRSNGVPYRGVNILLLWGDAMDKGFTSSTWMTFKQAQALGTHVRKGERGSTVVYADRTSRTEIDDQGEETERTFSFMKAYTVFNADQIDGLPETFRAGPDLHADRDPIRIDAAAEAFFAATGAMFRHGGYRAFYSPEHDMIQLPPVQAFRDAGSYAATKAHELIHWTGHKSRLARTFGRRFGDNAYAFEELVAELGAAFICAVLQLTPEPRADHAAYLSSWLSVLKADKRAIFTAAATPRVPADFLQGLQARHDTPEAQAVCLMTRLRQRFGRLMAIEDFDLAISFPEQELTVAS